MKARTYGFFMKSWNSQDSYSELYQKAGVNTVSGSSLIEILKPFAKKTLDPQVISGIGGFSALYDVSFLKEWKHPIAITATDGVGTKLSYASFFKRYETIGYDLVGMCANDILVSGGKPYLFLDYLAAGKLQVEEMSIVLRSIASACKMIGCNLMGGETAEHPGILQEEDFDLAGFMLGFAEKDMLLDYQNIQENDIVIGIPSSGIHSNGISLVRKLFFDPAKKNEKLPSREVMDFLKYSILLQSTILYEPIVRDLIEKKQIKGLVHITGGGFPENVPRILKDNLYMELDVWELMSPFKEIAEQNKIDFIEMSKVFNCGYGMLVIAEEQYEKELLKQISIKIKEYRKNYLQLQKEFFSEFSSYEEDWNLPFFSDEPEVLGKILSSSMYKRQILFRHN